MVNIAWIVERLAGVRGIVGIVLGGSRARGTAREDSDYDIGVYYANASELDIAGLSERAKELDDSRRDGLIVPPGGWGAWVNGGGWLVVDGMNVDIILRDIGRVERSVADCHAGTIHFHYQTGHPHAYINAMYAGELAIANILLDPDGRLARAREKMHPYPPALKKAILRHSAFEAAFSLQLASTYADKNDDYYVAAHIVRSLSCLNQMLFAHNGEYCLNEKKAVDMVNGFPHKPRDYQSRVAAVIAGLGHNNARACAALQTLIADAETLIAAADA